MKLTRRKLRNMILEAVDPALRASKFEQVPGLIFNVLPDPYDPMNMIYDEEGYEQADPVLSRIHHIIQNADHLNNNISDLTSNNPEYIESMRSQIPEVISMLQVNPDITHETEAVVLYLKSIGSKIGLML